MSVREIRDALTTAYSANVRLQAQDIGRVVTADLEKNQQKSKARNSNGGGNARRSDGAGPCQAQRQPQPVDPAALKAARRQAQLEQQKKAAARNASMFDKSAAEAGEDAFAPVQPASVSKPGRGSLSQKLASVLTQPAKPDPKHQTNSQQGRKLSASQQRSQPNQQQPAGKQGARPALNLQPTAAQKAAGSRNGQSLTALRSKAELKARAARAGGKQLQIDKSLPPPKAKATKVCRNCQEDVPLKDYFCEKRLPDGLMHMCMKCASKKGLSGKPATPEIIAAIMHSRSAAAAIQGGDRPSGGHGSAPSRGNGVPGGRSTASHARGGASNSRGAPVGQQRRAAPSVHGAGTLKGFYGGASGDGGSGARMAALGGRRQREDLDRYEDDFVEDDEEEEDWRAQLREVTGGWRKRREFSDDEGDDRMMEASAAEMRREEARSRRMGRQEDLAAEEEEEARLAAKAAAKRARAAAKKKRKPKKRRTGVGAFVNDEASDDDDEEEDSEDESE